MNLILLFEADFIAPQRARLTDRRLRHILEVHQPEPGQRLKVGLLNGAIGSALVSVLNAQEVILEVELDRAPPPPLPLTLVLALPRPKMLKRTLQTVATMGVKELWLINSWRVDKSYWSSPLVNRGRAARTAAARSGTGR